MQAQVVQTSEVSTQHYADTNMASGWWLLPSIILGTSVWVGVLFVVVF